MLHIKCFTVNPIGENTYLAWGDSNEAFIVDCGCFTESEWAEVKCHIEANGLRPTLLLNTHLHFDHSLGNRFAERDYGLRPRASRDDWQLYAHMTEQLQLFLGRSGWDDLNLDFVNRPGEPLKDGDELTVGGIRLRVIATPGHTRGGLCFLCEEEHTLFAGDTLFRGSYGRTDLPDGSWHEMHASLSKRLLNLPPETRVLTGHGAETTIGEERRHYHWPS